MSRIYDALQRAAQERLEARAGNVSDNAGGAEVEIAQPKRSPYVQRESTREAGTAVADQATSSDHPLDRPAVAAPEQTTDLTLASPQALEPQSWHPKLEQLPTLEERGPVVEQFRSLRSRLVGLRNAKPLKSVLISSGLPREGKTFVAANLAISFARHQASRVLLIDGDMRRGTLHELLGCSAEPGLSEYLNGTATMSNILQKAKLGGEDDPRMKGLQSLTFIAGGKEGDKAAELSGDSRFGELIQAAGKVFDWILVDTSPVNLVTDGVNLATACDGVLLVARGGVTRIETIQYALKELKNSQMLGVVLNALPVTEAPNTYYGYNSYDSKTEEPKPSKS